ncbi:hypothetical protein [Corynebacterium sp. HMSC078H07]|nr:hypothetical protein [Corynebacterium sp. HMSC078H07]
MPHSAPLRGGATVDAPLFSLGVATTITIVLLFYIWLSKDH